MIILNCTKKRKRGSIAIEKKYQEIYHFFGSKHMNFRSIDLTSSLTR